MVKSGGLINCESCGRTHRDQAQIEKCKTRKEKADIRAAKHAKNQEARASRQEAEPPKMYIIRRRKEGARWNTIVAELNREYFPPKPGARWSIVEVIDLHSQTLRWPRKGEEIKWPSDRLSIGKLQEYWWEWEGSRKDV